MSRLGRFLGCDLLSRMGGLLCSLQLLRPWLAVFPKLVQLFFRELLIADECLLGIVNLTD